MGFRRPVFVGLYAASGVAALIYEVTWTRLLTLQLGHTVAAASTVLAAFMGGLAIGAWIAGQSASPPAGDDGKVVALRRYAILELIVAATAIGLPFALQASVPALEWAYADGTAPARFGIVRIAISLSLLGVPAAAMGATFPIAASWYASDAADTGVLYAANTAGAALGAISAGFWLVPALGLRGTTFVGVAFNLLAAGGAWAIASVAAARNAEHEEAAETAESPSLEKKKNRNPRATHAPRALPRDGRALN